MAVGGSLHPATCNLLVIGRTSPITLELCFVNVLRQQMTFTCDRERRHFSKATSPDFRRTACESSSCAFKDRYASDATSESMYYIMSLRNTSRRWFTLVTSFKSSCSPNASLCIRRFVKGFLILMIQGYLASSN